MSNESTVTKKLRRTQEQLALQEGGSRSSAILSRLIDEVGRPLDETSLICQRLLDNAAAKLSPEQRKLIEAWARTPTWLLGGCATMSGSWCASR